jgi:hypothetical protein
LILERQHEDSRALLQLLAVDLVTDVLGFGNVRVHKILPVAVGRSGSVQVLDDVSVSPQYLLAPKLSASA